MQGNASMTTAQGENSPIVSLPSRTFSPHSNSASPCPRARGLTAFQSSPWLPCHVPLPSVPSVSLLPEQILQIIKIGRNRTCRGIFGE